MKKNQFFLFFLLLVIVGEALLIYDKQKNIDELKILNMNKDSKIEEITLNNSKLKNDLDIITKKFNDTELLINEQKKKIIESREVIINLGYESNVSYAILGVDYLNKGHVIPLKVMLKSGDGSIFIDIRNVLYDDTLQSSIDQAVAAAKEITNTTLNDTDIFIEIAAPLSVTKPKVGGGSAGAALSLAIISAIEENSLNKSILITGTVDSKNTIGQVGAIKEKAQAARDYGADYLIVPIGQNEYVNGIKFEEILTIKEAYNRAVLN